MRHRTLGVGHYDSVECLSCLWIGHVMQQGDAPIELHLGLLGAGDAKVNGSEGMAGVFLDLTHSVARKESGQDGN